MTPSDPEEDPIPATDLHVEATYRLTEALVASENRMRRRVDLLSEVVFETGRSGTKLSDGIEAELAEMLSDADDRLLRDDKKLEDAVRKIVRQVAMEEIGKKPEVTVVISRLLVE